MRPGDNKWSMTIFARNPDTGEAKWAYQLTPHDAWDYDGGQREHRRSICRSTAGSGRCWSTSTGTASRYTMDRTTGRCSWRSRISYVNWAKGIDLKTGRPEEVPEKRTGKG